MSKTDDIIIDWLEETKDDIISDANRQGRNKSGKIGNSLEVISEGHTHRLFGWRFIGQAWEYGRGKTVNTTPTKPKTLRENLEDWVRGIGIPEKQVKGIAYIMARKIHREGTVLFRKGKGKGVTGILENNINEKRLQTLQQRIAFNYETEILKNL